MVLLSVVYYSQYRINLLTKIKINALLLYAYKCNSAEGIHTVVNQTCLIASQNCASLEQKEVTGMASSILLNNVFIHNFSCSMHLFCGNKHTLS